MPILTASTPMSRDAPRRSARAPSRRAPACTASTPSVFCAVIAVIAVIAWPPSMVTVLMSAWMPAPPPLSEPAMIRMRGGDHRSGPCAPSRRDTFQQVRRPDRPRLEIAAAIGADVRRAARRRSRRRRCIRTSRCSAPALSGGRSRPQRSQSGRISQHQAAFTASQMLSTTSLDQRLVLALGHHPDQRLGARLADDQPAAPVEPRLAVGDRRLDRCASRAARRRRSGRS